MQELMDMGDAVALVKSTTEAGLVHLRLNNAAENNAFSLPMASALTDAIMRIDSASTRAVLISAEGRNFSVGGDLRYIGAADDQSAAIRCMADSLHCGMRTLAALGVPVVVAVNGNAAGAGLSLALSGDIVIGGEGSSYMLAYSAIGLSADGGVTFTLPKLVGLRLAQEMAYLNRRLNAAEALEAGMLTRVVADKILLEEALAVGRQLSAGPTGALRRMKHLIDAGYRSDFAHHVDEEADAITAAAASHDGREGIRAFLERRPPAFRGN